MTLMQGGVGDPFEGRGEVQRLCRSIDWRKTPLGPVDEWPAALRTTVRTILESPFPINLWCGPELVLIYNDAYREVLGSKHPDALGRLGAEVWAEIWEEVAPMFEQLRGGGPAVYADDAPFVVQGRETMAGEPQQGRPNAWFTFALSPVRDDDGEIIAFLNVVSESTRRVLAERASETARAQAELSEARLREVFTHAPAFLAVLRGPEHIFEFVNATYYQLVGHRELLGQPLFEALPDVRGQGFEELLNGVLETGNPYVGREVPVLVSRTPDSEPEQLYLDIVYYPITEADGSRSGVVAHGSDVTEHVLARQDAQRARLDAEEANRAKSQFLANMSHEIRTPINAIIGYTDLLDMGITGPVTEAQKAQMERVRQSSRHLLTLIEDILDLSKVEAGRLQVDRERVVASGTIASSLALVAPQADARGVRMEDACAGDAHTVYVGDEDRARQILVNLLSNAVKFTDAGGSVQVSCGVEEGGEGGEAGDAGEGRTFIRVADTGIGIAPEELDGVFLPFTQVERGHTRTRGGAGLGLTISRQLARLMGGDLTVESEPGKGSVFTLWLPVEPAFATALDEVVLEQQRVEEPRHLAAAGEALQARIPEVLHRFLVRLGSDPRVPRAPRTGEADLLDHASTFLADVAQSLVVLEKSQTTPQRLLQDGSEIQRLVAELHGGQRAQLGWTAEALSREWEILREEIEEAVRRGAGQHADLEGALQLMRQFMRRAEQISLRSLRSAGTGRAHAESPMPG
jgi:signal transduction histidine kinase